MTGSPEIDGTVRIPGREDLALRTVRNRVHALAARIVQGPRGPVRRHRPQVHQAVAVGRGQERAVVTKGQAPHSATVPVLKCYWWCEGFREFVRGTTQCAISRRRKVMTGRQ